MEFRRHDSTDLSNRIIEGSFPTIRVAGNGEQGRISPCSDRVIHHTPRSEDKRRGVAIISAKRTVRSDKLQTGGQVVANVLPPRSVYERFHLHPVNRVGRPPTRHVWRLFSARPVAALRWERHSLQAPGCGLGLNVVTAFEVHVVGAPLTYLLPRLLQPGDVLGSMDVCLFDSDQHLRVEIAEHLVFVRGFCS